LNRPYDEQGPARVRLETEAIELILNGVVLARVNLLWSDAIEIENSQNPFEERRAGIARWKEFASITIENTAAVRMRAKVIATRGVKPLDALHIASAVEGSASHFLTVDDGILKKRDRLR
jgi:hypothetical protein